MDQNPSLRILISLTVIATAMTVLTSTSAHAATPAPAGTFAAIASPETAAALTTTAEDPDCLRIRGAAACVGPDENGRPWISIQDTEADRLHATVEYYQNGYLGTKYVIHNLGGNEAVRGNHKIAKVVTFRAALYKGNRRIKASRWKTVHSVLKSPIKHEKRISPATARARSAVCTSTKGAAGICFTKNGPSVFACDTAADGHQARAEYFVGGDPTTRFEIHQLAGFNTCGKAEHGDLTMSKYRASLFHHNHRIATRLYRYH